MKDIVFLDPAKDEMADAAEYYEWQTKGLGFDFLGEVEQTTKRIQEFPESGKCIKVNTRRRLLKRFPFGIIYRLEKERIVVVAVMHLHRRPNYWMKRLKRLTKKVKVKPKKRHFI